MTEETGNRMTMSFKTVQGNGTACEKTCRILFSPGRVAENAVLEKDRPVTELGRNAAGGLQTLEIIRQIIHVMRVRILFVSNRFHHLAAGRGRRSVLLPDLGLDLGGRVDVETEERTGEEEVVVGIVETAFGEHVMRHVLLVVKSDVAGTALQVLHLTVHIDAVGHESAGSEDFDAAFAHQMEPFGREHGPMDIRGRRAGFFAGDPDQFVHRHIIVMREPFLGAMLIRPVGEFGQRMESQMQPVGIVLEFAPIGRRHLVDGEFRLVMVIPEKTFEDEFAPVFLMDGLQSFQIKMIEEPGRFLPGQIGHEETVVVDPHGIAFERRLVPDQHDALGAFAEFVFGGCGHGIDPGFERHFGAEFAVAADCGQAVDRDAALRIGDAPDFNRQCIGGFPAVFMIQNFTVAVRSDFQHDKFLLFLGI